MNKIYDSLLKKEKLRESLINLKQLLKDDAEKKKFAQITAGNYDFLMKLLLEEDPKVRKNVAAILGELKCQDALEVLWDSYDVEETMFVKADYIKAMSCLDCRELLDELQNRLQELTAINPKEDEKKHIQAEVTQIQKILLEQGKVKTHTFMGQHVLNEVILVTQPAFRTITAAQIKNAPTAMMGIGVKTKTTELDDILKIRTFKELLFVLHNVKYLAPDPTQITDGLLASDMMEVIKKNHNAAGPFYFRLGITGAFTMEEKSKLAKKTIALLEEKTGRTLVNSSSHYEIEIRLMQTKEGNLYPCLKFFTIKDNRFAYRKSHVSTGMQPYMAAGLIKLAEDYTKEYAQVLDPVCGAGTWLIERNYLRPTRTAYGIDIFGEAIEKARINTKTANMNINYINRDFRDFSHQYLFDEIWADMPQKGALTFDELDALNGKLFERAQEWLNPNGLLFVYSGEGGSIKKQIRLHEAFKLEKEFCISEKQKQYLYIIRYR